MENIPEIPERISEKLFQYQNTRSAFVEDWLPGGKGILIDTRFGETSQLHIVAMPGGARRQITFFNEPIGSAAVCPDPSKNSFLFTKDMGGNEFSQIYHFDIATGNYKMLTDGNSQNGGMQWSNTGDKFVFASTKRNKKDRDVYITSTNKAANEAKMIISSGGSWYPVEWSPDDSQVLALQYVSANESYLHIASVETGKMVQINPVKKKIAYDGAVWAKDGKGIYLASDEDTEFSTLRYYNVQSKTITPLTNDIRWDVEEMEISEKGDKLAFVTNENGISTLYILNTLTKKYQPVPNMPTGIIGGLQFHPDGNQLAMVINSAQSPGDVYVLDVSSSKLERWTFSEVGGLNPETFVAPSLIEYETFDKVGGKPRKIPAFYYKPKTGNGPYPVIIDIHGGPEGQYRPGFSSNFQYLVNELGIAVIAPNVRGSSGYGKTYLELDNGYKREESVQDIGKLLDWIAGQKELDASRIVVQGGSYGGYMVLACMTHFNDRLKAGIDVVGISNFVSFLQNTEAYRQDLRRMEYGDEQDPKMKEFLTKISPLTNATKITKPLFVIQGQNDPRVPASESKQMVETVRTNKGTVWYLLAKDEGHGFRKKSNRDFQTNAVTLFLEKYVLEKEIIE
ncbi:S9 family peptidase [Rhodocytophaga rosea]|uniref:S9 family peptidase n=2 Tax=Rhodocytophaga rosea TaxID=2704465 RepID=A0A6C0GVC1_9BACT|nr:S9 family peptidase [Rhodocytophaga rosea]